MLNISKWWLMGDLRKLRKSIVNIGYIFLKIPVMHFIKQVHTIYLYCNKLGWSNRALMFNVNMNAVHCEMLSQDTAELRGFVWSVIWLWSTYTIIKKQRNQSNLSLIHWSFKNHWVEAMKVVYSWRKLRIIQEIDKGS